MPPPVRRPCPPPARVVRVLAALALVTPTALPAASLPAPVIERGYELRKVGGGELRWLGHVHLRREPVDLERGATGASGRARPSR